MSLAPETPADSQEQKSTEVVKYHHIKSNLFRTFHGDGAWMQMMPSKKQIHLLFYTERLPIPTYTETFVGTSQENLKARIVGEGLEREMQVEIVLDIENAKKITSDLLAFLDKQTGKTP